MSTAALRVPRQDSKGLFSAIPFHRQAPTKQAKGWTIWRRTCGYQGPVAPSVLIDRVLFRSTAVLSKSGRTRLRLTDR